MTNHIFSWADIEQSIKILSSKIKTSGFIPDIIIAIPRGGIIPAGLLCHTLNVKKFFSLNVEKIGSERKIIAIIQPSIENKKILLVEDFLETGRSLIAAETWLKKYSNNIKTCAMYISNFAKIIPSYFIAVQEKMLFPWET